MTIPPIPGSENERLKTLNSYGVLDSFPEKEFDDLTALAAYICKTPIALISLVDESRQWFKSTHGLDAQQTPREQAFCAYTILQDRPFIVSDSLTDDRFFDNPLATGFPNVRYYAGAPLIAPNGERLGSLCVIDHVARAPEAEQIAALECLARQVISQLEIRKKVLALQTAETNLSLINQKLESALKIKALFLASVSHEIRTPMNGIIGLTDMLLETDLDELQRKNLELIESCGKSLVGIINDILDFSKIEAGHLQLENEPFDVTKMALDTVGLFKPLAQKKNLDLAIEIAEGLPAWLSGDTHRLRQVLSNLLSNAIKFTASGRIDVRVGLNFCCFDKQNHVFEISVSDTGIGVSEENKPKVFQSFSQATVSTAREFGGTGLGLAISKALCENMNGVLRFETAAGKGSVFSFTFRCAELVAPLQEPGLDAQSTPAVRLRVLLAEDNHVNQIVASKLLEKLGHDVTIASNGREALKHIHKTDFDVVLMDRSMPELNGLDATREIRKQIPKNRQPVIIALTASALQNERDECMNAGMDDFLTKPIFAKDLSAALSKFKRAA